MCRNGTCLYNVSYIYSSTSGALGTDTFTFPTHTGDFRSFPNVAFGCGYDNRNFNFAKSEGRNNMIAGIFGLGASPERPRSMLMQLEAETNGLFSYCLLSWTASITVHTYLRFGDDARIRGAARRIQTVRMAPGIPRYQLNLLEVSVLTEDYGQNQAYLEMGCMLILEQDQHFWLEVYIRE
ncbi:Aspartic proteinase [Quillaja saponaria]|uniref:Aspartic proteinase n=1 Tax=Quillaja saponaria TaxID=32244 RepID=A0AAD7Q245_QUISA|nr:Aspartic proteinase [Quillaja saponaria]